MAKAYGILNKKSILVERRYLQPFSRKLHLKFEKQVIFSKNVTLSHTFQMCHDIRQNHPFFQPSEAIFSKTIADIFFQRVYFFCLRYRRIESEFGKIETRPSFAGKSGENKETLKNSTFLKQIAKSFL